MADKRFFVKNGLDNNSKTIINVADPVSDQDVATKKYASNATNLTSGTLYPERLPALSGDITTRVGTSLTTLSNSGVTAGTYGSASIAVALTIDAKGRITRALNSPISIPFSSITNKPTTLAGYGITDGGGSGAGLSLGGTINGDLTVTGSLVVNGSRTIINSLITTVNDPVFTLGGQTAPSSNDRKDRGIEFNYHDGTSGKKGFFGYSSATKKFTFIPNATNSGEVFSGAIGTIAANCDTATKLSSPITITLTGDITGTVGSIDGSANITIPTILPNIVTPGTYQAVTVDAKGRVISGSTTGDGSSGSGPTLTHGSIFTGTFSTTTVSQNQVMDSFAKNTSRCSKYLIQATQGNNYHYTEVMVIHDNLNTYITEFGTLFNVSSLFTVDADISVDNTNMRLLVTPKNTGTIVFKYMRLQINI